jgi:SAM-dependent methyltransferase
MKIDPKKIRDANRAAWNEVMPYHRKAWGDKLLHDIAKEDYSSLDQIIIDKLNEIGLKGKSVAQICCNNGRESISLRNLGAASVTGFDISDEAIKEARKLNKIAGKDCRFVRADIYDIGETYFDQFDIVFITIGSLSWMPDLSGFFQVVSRMLKKGGNLVIYEMHPFLYTMPCTDDPDYEPKKPYNVAYSYFRKDAWENDDGIDYLGGQKYKGKKNYSYTQTMSDIINPIIKNGMALRELQEYPHDISNIYGFFEKEQKLPLCFILIASKN